MDAERRLARLVAALSAAAALVVGLWWGAHVAGGSDSYCYVEQAERLASGTMHAPIAPALAVSWRERALSLAPTGFIPSPVTPGAIAPICPAGYAIALVPFRLAGGPDAVFLVVPLLGACAVWLTYLLGLRLAGARAGALAALQLATAPVFLYQVVQPMSDVPAAAWWTLALVLVLAPVPRAATHLAAGAAIAAAVLTRPNLVGLAIVLLASVALRPAATGAHPRARWRHALLLCAGAAPGALALAAWQTWIYGSPARSGYGSLALLFSWDHVLPNLARYGRWLLDTQPLALAAPLALATRMPPTDATRPGEPVRIGRWQRTTLLVFAGVTIASYLPYVPFDDWTYLRFLLPALPALLALASLLIVRVASALPTSAAGVATTIVALTIAGFSLHVARERGAFVVHRIEAKFRVAGEVVATMLPSDAVVLTIWHSGSVRTYGHRLSVVWDALAPEELGPAIAALESGGHPVYLLLERWEERAFRSRFAAHTPVGGLDWPPMARVGREVQIWAAADRARYFAGARIDTRLVPLAGRR